MKSISEITKYLFEADYFAEEFDADDSYEHYDCAQELMKEYKWNDIFAVWYDFLLSECNTSEDVINYVNLFVYYGGQDQAIKNPYEFLGYLYYRVNMDEYWDVAGDLFDGLAISVLENCGKINIVKNPFYSPGKDPELLAAIQLWREKYE